MERALAAAETIDANADDLADALAAEIGDIGRAEIRSSIARAVDDLQAALGPSEALSTIVSELERMERSYG
ncbi:MAG TPA: hypothetical protein VGM39_02525, partial [Kofleriaceae bacterium]